MSDTKTPRPVAPTRPTRGMGGWLPDWLLKRTSWAPNQPLAPATDATTDALTVTAPFGDVDPATLKPVIGPPAGYEIAFEAVIQALANEPAPLRGATSNVWGCLGADSAKRGRLGDCLEKGTSSAVIISTFLDANARGAFADEHYSGAYEWAALLSGRPVPINDSAAPTNDLPPTKDVREAYHRLVDGIGWAGNRLTPTAYSEAEVCVWARPKGYEASDELTVLFVFGFSLDNAAAPAYADMYAALTPEAVLELQYRTGKPSGGEDTQVLPGPGGKAPKTPKGKS